MRRIAVLLIALASAWLSSEPALGSAAGVPNASTVVPVPSGAPNVQVQSASIALAPQCQPGKTVLVVTATLTNTGGNLPPNTLSIIAVDSLIPAFGRIDFAPALAGGHTETMIINVAYLQPNPQNMVGTRTFGVGIYGKTPTVNAKITIPAAFCGFNPALSATSSHAGATSVAVNPLYQPSLPMPIGLHYATDFNTCSQHIAAGQCTNDIGQKGAFLYWDPGTCSGANCVSHIQGYHVYEVPHGWQPPRPPGVLNASAVNASLANPSQSSNASSAVAAPAAGANAAPASSASVASNPKYASAHVAPLQQPTLVLTTSADPRFGELTPPHTVSRCFTVASYWSSVESLYSDPVCIPSNAHVGTIRLTLDPTFVGTAYGGIRCTGPPPFAHPGGSVIAGDSAGNNGYCPYYQGMIAFDLSGLNVNPAYVANGALTYDFLGYFNADGSADGGQFQGYKCSTLNTTPISLEKLGDPHNGLVMTDNYIDQLWSNGVHPIGLTQGVNSAISKNGVLRVVIGNYGGISVLGQHCYSEWGNFHLVIDAYGTQ